MKCRICGAELETGARECPYCGENVRFTERGSPQSTAKPGEMGKTQAFDIVRGSAVKQSEQRAQTEEKKEIKNKEHSMAQNDETIVQHDRVRRAYSFCSKCGRPLDGRTGKCIICDYASVGRAGYGLNGNSDAGGDNNMAKKKKKKNAAGIVILAVLGMILLFCAAFAVVFKMFGGEFAPAEETPSPQVSAAVSTPVPTMEAVVTSEPVKETKATQAPAVTSNPKHEAQEGDPAEFRGGSYIYDTHNRVITQQKLAELADSRENARKLYYEMYARYGMVFDDDDLINYFENTSAEKTKWYVPDGGSDKAEIYSRFNDVEKKNDKIIYEYMVSNGWE